MMSNAESQGNRDIENQKIIELIMEGRRLAQEHPEIAAMEIEPIEGLSKEHHRIWSDIRVGKLAKLRAAKRGIRID